MTFIASDPTAPYRHALNAWVSPLATCAHAAERCLLLTYLGEFLRGRHASPSVDERNTVLEAIKSQHKTNFTFRFRSREPR